MGHGSELGLLANRFAQKPNNTRGVLGMRLEGKSECHLRPNTLVSASIVDWGILCRLCHMDLYLRFISVITAVRKALEIPIVALHRVKLPKHEVHLHVHLGRVIVFLRGSGA